jgi:Domain of unknown function (DUF4402)
MLSAGLSATMVGLALPSETQAKPAKLEIISQKELRFGTFGVLTSGSRVVSPSGAVTSIAIIPVAGSATGPAEFTVSYDRGNESRRSLNLVIEVFLMEPPRVTQGGLSAAVGDFTTDLPGVTSLVPGRPVTIAINNCQTRVCARSFRVGGRLQIQRSYGGGTINVPLPIVANLISVDGSKP